MNLFKIILIIMTVWLVVKVKRFIAGIQITSAKPTRHQKKKNSKIGMDIQDADYEDVE